MVHGPWSTPRADPFRVQWCGGVVVGGQGEVPNPDWALVSLLCTKAGLYVTESLIDGCLTPQGFGDLTV